MSEQTPAAIALRWGKSETRFIAWADASFACMFLVGIPAGLATDRPITGLLFAALAAGPAWVSRRAFQILRSPDPTIALEDSGIRIQHPLLAEPLTISAADLHSLWMGPFEQAPRTRQDFWYGRRLFPAETLDVSGFTGKTNEADQLVAVFTRTLSLRPPLRLPVAIWVLHRSWPPLLTNRSTNGLRVVVQDHEAASTWLQSTGLTRLEMPSDVRSWLS